MNDFLQPRPEPVAPPRMLASPIMHLPPRMHWGWVLGLNVVTRGLFAPVWLIVEANWVRKVRGKSLGLTLAITHVCSLPVASVFLILPSIANVPTNSAASVAIPVLGFVMFLGLWIATTLILRKELENEPIGIPLSGVMSVLFGPVYFQYHLRDYGGPTGTQTPDGELGLPRRNA